MLKIHQVLEAILNKLETIQEISFVDVDRAFDQSLVKYPMALVSYNVLRIDNMFSKVNVEINFTVKIIVKQAIKARTNDVLIYLISEKVKNALNLNTFNLVQPLELRRITPISYSDLQTTELTFLTYFNTNVDEYNDYTLKFIDTIKVETDTSENNNKTDYIQTAYDNSFNNDFGVDSNLTNAQKVNNNSY